MKIVGWFEEFVTPLVQNSPYFNALYSQVEVGNKYHIEAMRRHLGIKNIDVERQKVPHMLSIVFNDVFDLNDFYINIVEIIVFNDVYFMNELDFIIFDYKNIYPQSYDQSDLEYWASTLDSFKSQNKKLETYISQINLWLDSTTKS
ncbi:hypothetical protein [Moritella sp.]|uniref:hypothetical protein n=1 Tax=Moritella sp. TaxID=78556 RepID=UPI001E1A96C2|nr:hypothetical protein [Moritella sp.]MCJ8352193.1 hypothetical protein [Moritella sp.]NQZ42408.1 hypothetical protein [Moritella sp.]